jgi:hypothetical protein
MHRKWYSSSPVNVPIAVSQHNELRYHVGEMGGNFFDFDNENISQQI